MSIASIRLLALLPLLLCLGCGESTPAGPDDAGADEDADAGIPCEGSGISKGPWVLAMDETHVTVRWEACRAGTSGDITYVPEAGGAAATATATETPTVVTTTFSAPLNPNATPDYAGTWYMHDAALSGLAPATCYTYALAADATRTGRFCTSRKPGDPIRFLAIGDTNPALGDSTTNVLSHVLPKNPDFTLHLGDIEYYDSTLETWALWAGKMQPLLSQGAFLPAVGNHELEKPTEYAEYTLRFFHGAGFDGNDEHYHFESGGVHFFVLDTQEPTDGSSAQAAWFAEQIVEAEQQPGYRFSIVYFHKPFVTCGDTGDDPAARQYFEPLFLQHKVPLVLQAHMHGYERFEIGALTYVTSGGGGGAIGDVNQNVSRSYCSDRVVSGGFFNGTVIDVDATTLTGTVIDDQGVVRDTFQKTVP